MNEQLLKRYEEIDALIESMNREALRVSELPFVRREAYLHFTHVDQFLTTYSRRLRPSPEDYAAWRDFVCEDTTRLKSRIGSLDLYAFTFHYLKQMTFRTGNLDTPDDCVEILDLDRFLPYMEARQKEFRRQPLTEEEKQIVSKHLRGVLRAMKEHLPELPD